MGIYTYVYKSKSASGYSVLRRWTEYNEKTKEVKHIRVEYLGKYISGNSKDGYVYGTPKQLKANIIEIIQKEYTDLFTTQSQQSKIIGVVLKLLQSKEIKSREIPVRSLKNYYSDTVDNIEAPVQFNKSLKGRCFRTFLVQFFKQSIDDLVVSHESKTALLALLISILAKLNNGKCLESYAEYENYFGSFFDVNFGNSSSDNTTDEHTATIKRVNTMITAFTDLIGGRQKE